MTNLPASSEEEESFDYTDSAFDEDFKFECSVDDDIYEEDTNDYLTPTEIPENEVKKCDQIVTIEIPSLESITKDHPVEMEPIYFDRYKLTPQFVIDSVEEYSVFCCLKCEESILLDISLYIPSLGKNVYNRYCRFGKNIDTQELSQPLFSKAEIPTEPIPNAYFSFHYYPPEKFCRQYFNCIGLVNPSMTCYLNSLIQCLFHLKKFRETVFSWQDTKSGIANAMRVLFTRMQVSYVPVSTKDLTTAFGWNGSDLFIQHDVQELTRILFSRLDDVTNNSASRIFKGKNEESLITSQFQKSSTEDFSDLSLTVNGVSSLEESLNKYYEPDKLTGDDQYKLEDGTKVDAEVRTKVIENPTILSFHLRRFEYSTEMMKVYSRFEYGESLVFNGEEYELLSIIAHNGSVRGGHYNAFVKIDGNWTIFDDECVRHCETYEALDQNFGSDEKGQFTAYVLFYGKKGVNDIPDPPAPQDVIDAEKERLSNTKIRISYGNFANWYDIKVKKNLDSKSFIDVLSKETEIPADQIVVRIVKDHFNTEVFEYPIPDPSYRLYIDNSPLLPIWVQFWIPGYEIISLGTFHVNNVDTLRMLGYEVLRTVGMLPQNTHTLTDINKDEPKSDDLNKYELDAFIKIDDDYSQVIDSFDQSFDQSCYILFQFANKSATNENYALFKENIMNKKKEKVLDGITILKETKSPQYESHLNLIPDEIHINNVKDYIYLVANTFNFSFIPFDDPENEEKKFILSLSRHLTFEQLLKCISRKLSGEDKEIIDINKILLFLPDKFFKGPSHRAINKEVFDSIEKFPENYDCLYYQVFDEDMNVFHRADVSLIGLKGKLVRRLSVLFPRGKKNTINELREKLTQLFEFDNYYLYYVKDYTPLFIYSLIEGEDENEKRKNYGESEILFDYKIFAQIVEKSELMKIKGITENNNDGDELKFDYKILDEDDILKLRVIRCDKLNSFVFCPHYPFVLFTQKGIKWKDIIEMFPEEKIELMNQKSKITPDEQKEMNEDDLIAFVYTSNINSLFWGDNSLLKIKDEINELKNYCSNGEEEEEEEEEAEEEKLENEAN